MSYDPTTYEIKAIETRYKGYLFRSRLEATWAAFFDLCGWPWEYEPFELGGWLPDFILFGKTKVLVEVKPVFEFPRGVADKISKASKNFSDVELMILGCSIIKYDFADSCIGWVTQGNRWWEGAVLKYADNNFVDFTHTHGRWEGYISGHYDGSVDICLENAKLLFARAKETTRYIHKH